MKMTSKFYGTKMSFSKSMFCVAPPSQPLTIKRQFGKETVFSDTSQQCVGRYENLEDAAHLFLHCDFFLQIWCAMYNCLGFVLVTSLNISDHLV